MCMFSGKFCWKHIRMFISSLGCRTHRYTVLWLQVISESVSECSNKCRELLYPCKACHLYFRQWQQNTCTIHLQPFHGSSCILLLSCTCFLYLQKQTFCFLLNENKNKLILNFICREKRAMAKQVTFHIYILLKDNVLTEKSLFL